MTIENRVNHTLRTRQMSRAWQNRSLIARLMTKRNVNYLRSIETGDEQEELKVSPGQIKLWQR